LTIPITSYTIALPASLRSDHLIGINRNADRHHAGALIDFTGIRKEGQIAKLEQQLAETEDKSSGRSSNAGLP
jgi:hypothetical protein